MRFQSSIIFLLALVHLGHGIECPNTCDHTNDVHCATDETCYHTDLNYCLQEVQSCYREKRGLPAFNLIVKGYCRWGLPKCEHFRD